MSPEAGDIWEWCGGQKYLLLQHEGTSYLGNKFLCMCLASGETKIYMFADRDIRDRGWRRLG